MQAGAVFRARGGDVGNRRGPRRAERSAGTWRGDGDRTEEADHGILGLGRLDRGGERKGATLGGDQGRSEVLARYLERMDEDGRGAAGGGTWRVVDGSGDNLASCRMLGRER